MHLYADKVFSKPKKQQKRESRVASLHDSELFAADVAKVQQTSHRHRVTEVTPDVGAVQLSSIRKVGTGVPVMRLPSVTSVKAAVATWQSERRAAAIEAEKTRLLDTRDPLLKCKTSSQVLDLLRSRGVAAIENSTSIVDVVNAVINTSLKNRMCSVEITVLAFELFLEAITQFSLRMSAQSEALLASGGDAHSEFVQKLAGLSLEVERGVVPLLVLCFGGPVCTDSAIGAAAAKSKKSMAVGASFSHSTFNVQPTIEAIAPALHVLVKRRYTEAAFAVHHTARRQWGIRGTVETFNWLLSLCLWGDGAGRDESDHEDDDDDVSETEVASVARKKSTVAGSTVPAASPASTGQVCDADTARGLLIEMRNVGVEPNAHTFNTLLHVFEDQGINEQLNLLVDMTKAGFRPNVHTINSLLRGALQQKGDNFHYVQEWVGRMDATPTPEIVRRVMISAARHSAIQFRGTGAVPMATVQWCLRFTVQHASQFQSAALESLINVLAISYSDHTMFASRGWSPPAPPNIRIPNPLLVEGELLDTAYERMSSLDVPHYPSIVMDIIVALVARKPLFFESASNYLKPPSSTILTALSRPGPAEFLADQQYFDTGKETDVDGSPLSRTGSIREGSTSELSAARSLPTSARLAAAEQVRTIIDIASEAAASTDVGLCELILGDSLARTVPVAPVTAGRSTAVERVLGLELNLQLPSTKKRVVTAGPPLVLGDLRILHLAIGVALSAHWFEAAVFCWRVLLASGGKPNVSVYCMAMTACHVISPTPIVFADRLWASAIAAKKVSSPLALSFLALLRKAQDRRLVDIFTHLPIVRTAPMYLCAMAFCADIGDSTTGLTLWREMRAKLADYSVTLESIGHVLGMCAAEKPPDVELARNIFNQFVCYNPTLSTTDTLNRFIAVLVAANDPEILKVLASMIQSSRPYVGTNDFETMGNVVAVDSHGNPTHWAMHPERITLDDGVGAVSSNAYNSNRSISVVSGVTITRDGQVLRRNQMDNPPPDAETWLLVLRYEVDCALKAFDFAREQEEQKKREAQFQELLNARREPVNNDDEAGEEEGMWRAIGEGKQTAAASKAAPVEKKVVVGPVDGEEEDAIGANVDRTFQRFLDFANQAGMYHGSSIKRGVGSVPFEKRKPTIEHFNVLLEYCEAVKNKEKAMEVLEKILENDIAPDIHSYNHLLRLYSSNPGMINAILARMTKASIEFNESTWRVLARTGHAAHTATYLVTHGAGLPSPVSASRPGQQAGTTARGDSAVPPLSVSGGNATPRQRPATPIKPRRPATPASRHV